MVLAYYGDSRTEVELRLLLDTQPSGTRVGNVMRLSGPAFEVYLRQSSLVELQEVLADKQPPIIFLKTGPLEYWSQDIAHTAVLVSLDSVTVALQDPYFGTAPQTMSLQAFAEAWAQTGQFTAFLRPRTKP